MVKFFCMVGLLLASIPSHADVGQAFGFGSRASSLGGRSAAHGGDGFAAYANPAAPAANRSEKRFQLSTAVIFMRPQFDAIDGVVIENSYVGDATRTGSVDNDYRATLGQAVGAVIHLAPDWWNLSLGVTGFLPLEQIAYLDTGETYVPEYVLYRARTQRPQLDFSLAAQPLPGFSFGAGLHLGFSLTSVGIIHLGGDANSVSTMRFSASMKPKLTPYFGLHYRNTQSTPESMDEAGEFATGLTVRLPTVYDNSMRIDASARVLGALPGLDFNFDAMSALYYDPLSVELGFSWRVLPFWTTYAQAEAELWTLYQSPALNIGDPEVASAGVTVQPSDLPPLPLRNIFILRAGQEFHLGRHSIRAGYAYRPGIFGGDRSGAGNYLDPDQHVGSIGYGIGFKSLLGYKADWTLDTHLALHYLVRETITKSAGDESGAAGSKIGSPGYVAGGFMGGGGVSVSLRF
jgi:hypothetical protein